MTQAGLDPARVDEKALIDFIETITRIESPTSSAEGVNRVLDEIETAFAGTGARIERNPTGEPFGDILKVSCHPGRNEPGVLVLCHVDTVHPIGTAAGALPVRREGDRLYGPGVYDMKAGVGIAIAAAKRIMAEGRRTALPVTFLFTPDEEVGSPVSRHLIEEEARRNRYALVTEPARDGGKIVTARKGVGRFTVATRGKPAHAGAYHQNGASAIREMAKLIVEIENFTDYERGITVNVGLVSGGTGVNVIPEHCLAEIDLRVCDDATGLEMVERFHALKSSDPRVEVTVTGEMNRPPYARNAGVDAMFAVGEAVAQELGFKLESVPLTGGGSDGNFTIAQGVPTLDGLGCDGAGAHTNDEYIRLSCVVERTLFLQGLMERLA